MTYRELLQLYKTGQLDEKTRQQVEQAIEQQDAISDYLFEENELPSLAFPEEPPAALADSSADSEHFVKMIQRSIRRAFIKMGAIVGAVILAIVLCSIFVLPRVVSSFYYDPNQIMGVDPESDQITTERMQLDLAVYSELFLPMAYRDEVYAEPQGYGRYSLKIPQTVQVDDRSYTTVSGQLVRNHLTLYDSNPLSQPVDNVLLPPQGIRNNTLYLDHEGNALQAMGPAGSAEEALSALESLHEDDYYLSFISLGELMDFEDFHSWVTQQKVLKESPLWCSIAVLDETNYLYRNNIGVLLKNGGLCLNWDREKYPHLSLLDIHDDSKQDGSDAEVIQTHFLSMLAYQRDYPEFAEMMHNSLSPYLCDLMIEAVKRDGLRTFGFAISAQKETLLALHDDPLISYIYTVPLP